MVEAVVHPADIQDRDGGALVAKALKHKYPWLRHLFADGGYSGRKFASALKKAGAGWSVQIIKRSDKAKGFEVLPRRWVSRELSHGLAETADWPKISILPSQVPQRGSSSPPSLSSSDASPDY